MVMDATRLLWSVIEKRMFASRLKRGKSCGHTEDTGVGKVRVESFK